VRKLYNGMIPCYLYQYFKPAERIAEEQKGSKKNFQKKFDKKFDGKKYKR